MRGGPVPATIFSVLAASAIVYELSVPGGVAAQPVDGTAYTSQGELLLPVDFHNWIFVGSILGLGYAPGASLTTSCEQRRQSLQRFHNIYINRAAFQAYLQTGVFPNNTVLVMDIYAADQRAPKGIVDRGSFDGRRLGVEVAVKNSPRPDGRPTPWAYYDFTSDEAVKFEASAGAFDDDACYACHKQHASDDNVQFYPVLRRLKHPE